MAVIESGASSTLLTIDASNLAARVSPRPAEHGSGGHYSFAKRTGTLPAALAANAELVQFRWTHASMLAVVTEINFTLQVLTAFTAHQEVSFEASVARSWSAAGTGGGTATFTGNLNKMRASHATSQMASGGGEIRVATTAALGAGTKTLDTDPFAVALGSPNIVNAAAGTAYSPYNRPTMQWRAEPGNGQYPLVLATNEGFVIRNMIVWPVAGTGVAAVEIKWAEVTAY